MNILKSLILTTVSLGLLCLGACNSRENQASAPASIPSVSSPAPSSSPAPKSASAMADHPDPAHHYGAHDVSSGTVVESGSYQLKFVPEKEGAETHLDLFLEKTASHEAVPNAKVTANIQLPDGTQKSVAMVYDAAEKHYTVKIPSAATGEYKVDIQSVIGSETVKAHYTF